MSVTTIDSTLPLWHDLLPIVFSFLSDVDKYVQRGVDRSFKSLIESNRVVFDVFHFSRLGSTRFQEFLFRYHYNKINLQGSISYMSDIRLIDFSTQKNCLRVLTLPNICASGDIELIDFTKITELSALEVLNINFVSCFIRDYGFLGTVLGYSRSIKELNLDYSYNFYNNNQYSTKFDLSSSLSLGGALKLNVLEEISFKFISTSVLGNNEAIYSNIFKDIQTDVLVFCECFEDDNLEFDELFYCDSPYLSFVFKGLYDNKFVKVLKFNNLKNNIYYNHERFWKNDVIENLPKLLMNNTNIKRVEFCNFFYTQNQLIQVVKKFLFKVPQRVKVVFKKLNFTRKNKLNSLLNLMKDFCNLIILQLLPKCAFSFDMLDFLRYVNGAGKIPQLSGHVKCIDDLFSSWRGKLKFINTIAAMNYYFSEHFPSNFIKNLQK